MIKTLVMEQFLPFRDRVELPLSDQGFVLVRGNNKVSAAANDNGSGKTSIAHAISWGLFGEDLLGRRADAVACRFTEGQCLVRLDMEDDLGAWSVLRTRRPHSLQVEGIPGIGENEDARIIETKIAQRLGFGLRTFRNAVIFGQGSFDRFQHADQAEQMRMLDEIQGVDFREAAKRCKDWRDQLNAKLMASPMPQLNVSLTAARMEIASLTGVRDDFVREKQKRLDAITARLESARHGLRNDEQKLTDVHRDAELLKELRDEEAIEISLGGALSLTKQDEDVKGAFQDELGRNLAEMMERLNRLVKDGECPYCRAKAPKSGAHTPFKKDLDAATRKHQQACAAYKKALGVTARAQERHREQKAKLQTLLPSTASDPARYIGWLEERCSPKAIKAVEFQVQQAKQIVTAIQAEYEAEQFKKWEGQGALGKAEERETLLIASIAREMGRVEKIQIALAIADYWQEAFSDRGIRSLLVDSVADYVNGRMVYHLDKLAAGEARTLMSAQTALKKGGAKDQISFTTAWDWGAQVGLGSGGQEQRVNLAVFAAIQDLAEMRSARPFPLKIWDEPGDALDSRGQELFLEWISAEARKRGTGLLITHSDSIAAQADPDQIWTVVMDADGAHVER